MAQTVLNLWNQALGMLGNTNRVEATDEASPEARACNLYYETARDAVFAAAPWTDLTAYSRLANFATRDDAEDWVATDPPPGWLYAFARPSDMVRPRYQSGYERFIVARVGSTRVIATNVEAPILVYTARVENPVYWGVDLYETVMFSLAAHIAKAVTGNDSDLNNMYTLAQERILIARANDANLNWAPMESNPEWLTARGQALASPNQRYFYPSAEFTVAGAHNLG